MASLFEEMGGTYHLGADGFCYPDLLPPKKDAPAYGKYGRLNAHLSEIDAAANTQMELLTKQMATAQSVNEELKSRDQMAWVGAMNEIRSAAEEVALHNLIYS